MTETKRYKHYCFNCGELLGEFTVKQSQRDFDVCSSPECGREQRYAFQEIEAQAREDAEADGYSRYGGFGPRF